MFVAVGTMFLDVSRIQMVRVVEEGDQRESYRVLYVTFDNGGETLEVALGESEAHKSPFFKGFLTGSPVVHIG